MEIADSKVLKELPTLFSSDLEKLWKELEQWVEIPDNNHSS